MDWLRALRVYLAAIAMGNLAWEALHLPLYTLWQTGTPGEIAFAVVHCTLGDLLIALSTLTLALVLVGDGAWPARHFWHVAAIAMLLGVGYTRFHERLNVVVRASWAYAELMPVLPLPGGFAVGLSPLLQWVVVPLAAFWWAQRRAREPAAAFWWAQRRAREPALA